MDLDKLKNIKDLKYLEGVNTIGTPVDFIEFFDKYNTLVDVVQELLNERNNETNWTYQDTKKAIQLGEYWFENPKGIHRAYESKYIDSYYSICEQWTKGDRTPKLLKQILILNKLMDE